MIFPDLGAPAQAVAVPAPTVSGYTAYSNTYGNYSGYQSGNYLSGNYSGYTTTNMVPTYDYSAQNAAAMHNLGASIRNNMIAAQNQARTNMINTALSSNFRLGKISSGEKLLGYLHAITTIPDSKSYTIQYTINGKKYNVDFE
jgi:hypothetical protein